MSLTSASYQVVVGSMKTDNLPVYNARAQKLAIEDCFVGVEDKLRCLETLALKNGINFDEIAFVGDDVNDLECLKRVGVSACPADAFSDVRAVCSYVSSLKGGNGAVRDVCSLLMNSSCGH